MGREAQVLCTVDGKSEPVKALLESTVLILRGVDIKRRFEVAALAEVRVRGQALRFTAAGEAVTLALGAQEAQAWLKKLTTPPPSLASKLGVGAGQRARVFGPCDDAALAAALEGATTSGLADAAMLVAVALDAAELDRAVALHARMPCRTLWVVHAKGKAATLGDTAIRQSLRGRGYTDTKTTAVSERLTATRYTRR